MSPLNAPAPAAHGALPARFREDPRAWRTCAVVKERVGKFGSPRPISISTMPSRRTREHTASVSSKKENGDTRSPAPSPRRRSPDRRQGPPNGDGRQGLLGLGGGNDQDGSLNL